MCDVTYLLRDMFVTLHICDVLQIYALVLLTRDVIEPIPSLSKFRRMSDTENSATYLWRDMIVICRKYMC